MVLPGLINLDFADVRTVMTEMGKAMMGTGEATGEDRAMMAAQNAIANPLLDEVSLKGAKAVLVNVTGGMDMTLLEVDEAANAISDQVDPEANIIFGAAFDPSLEGRIRVSVVATGMDGASIAAIEPRAAATNLRSEPVRRPLAPPATAPVQDPITSVFAAPISAPEPMKDEHATQADLDREQDLFDQAIAAEPGQSQYQPSSAEPSEPYRPEPSVRPLGSDFGASDRGTGEVRMPAKPVDAQPTVTKAGWRGLFGGRPRHEMSAIGEEPAPVPVMKVTSAVQPVIEAEDDFETNATDDLEIPSFLRRLAN
jgi:cell division protein FtsZ